MKEKKAFGKLKYPVLDLKEGEDILYKFPELAKIKEFAAYGGSLTNDLDRNKVIKYIILLYDINSDLIEQKDLQKRKESAATLAGFERHHQTDEFSKKVKDMFELKDRTIYEMIFAYLREQNIMEWMLLKTTEQAFYENQKLIIKPIDVDSGDKEKDILGAATTKEKLSDISDKYLEKMHKYEKLIFGDNKDVQEEVKKPVRPETMISK